MPLLICSFLFSEDRQAWCPVTPQTLTRTLLMLNSRWLLLWESERRALKQRCWRPHVIYSVISAVSNHRQHRCSPPPSLINAIVRELPETQASPPPPQTQLLLLLPSMLHRFHSYYLGCETRHRVMDRGPGWTSFGWCIAGVSPWSAKVIIRRHRNKHKQSVGRRWASGREEVGGSNDTILLVLAFIAISWREPGVWRTEVALLSQWC